MTINAAGALARTGRLATLLFALTATSACSLLAGGRAPADIVSTAATERTVALDFTNALSQLDGYGPNETIVRLEQDAADDAFLEAMRTTLRERGYAVRTVAGGSDANVLRYRREEAEASTDDSSGVTARHDVYEIALGVIRMRREYDVGAAGRIAPASPLYVRGADASAIRLDESIFDPATPATPTPPATPAATPRERDEDTDGTIAAGDDASLRPVVVGHAGKTASAATARSRAGRTLPGELVPQGAPRVRGAERSIAALTGGDVNMFELGTSNFDDVFTAYEDVDEAVLVFADDSLNLGKRNKRVVEAMVARFDADSDLFSVVGCSLGPTRLSGGNAALALGRAGRVREALLFSGVEQERILDEGCWAGGGSQGELPARGVVVTLKRRRG